MTTLHCRCDKATRRANQQNLSIPSHKNISLNPSGKSKVKSRPSRPARGAYRDRHGRRVRDAVAAAMPGAQDVRRADVSVNEHSAPDESIAADGKTVWSWRPWLASSFAKTKFARPGSGFAVNSQGDGGKRNSSPGRARHKPSSHCAGKAGCSPLDLYARVRAFCAHCTRDRGCSAHPVFPAPSRLRRAERAGTTRARCAARTRWHIRL